MSTFDTDYKYYNTLLKTTYKTGILALKKLMKEPDKMNTLVNSLGGMSLIFDQLTYDPLTYKDNNSKLRELILVSEWGETASMTYFKVLFGEDADIDTILNDADKYKLITDDVNKIIALSGSDILCAKIMAKYIGVDTTTITSCSVLISNSTYLDTICNDDNFPFIVKLSKLVKVICHSSSANMLKILPNTRQLDLLLEFTTTIYSLLSSNIFWSSTIFNGSSASSLFVNTEIYWIRSREFLQSRYGLLTLAYYPELISTLFKSSNVTYLQNIFKDLLSNIDFIKIFFNNYKAIQAASFNLYSGSISSYLTYTLQSWLNTNITSSNGLTGADNEAIYSILDKCPFNKLLRNTLKTLDDTESDSEMIYKLPSALTDNATAGFVYCERPMLILISNTGYPNDRYPSSAGFGTLYSGNSFSMSFGAIRYTMSYSNNLKIGNISANLKYYIDTYYTEQSGVNYSCLSFYPVSSLKLTSINSGTSTASKQWYANMPGDLVVIFLDEEYGEYEEYLEGVD